MTIGLERRRALTTSKELSIRLARTARIIRDRITATLAIEAETADMYAQTIAYGLLSARIVDPHRKTTGDFAAAAHLRTSPFLRDWMETSLDLDVSELDLDVSEVVDLLDNADMEAVVRDFRDRNPQEDPVIHFYELFLKEYDAKKRMQRGVFYTPRPVVSFIVRSVDELLRRQFGLADGLADASTWAEVAARHDHLNLKIPEGVSPEQDFVQILDPATGTGTFLVEVIDSIHRTLVEKWRSQGHGETCIDALWNEYVPKHLLTRLHGYELLMAPCAIAHVKVGLKLLETGYRFGSGGDERARVYLTNALERVRPGLRQASDCFTVVIGNPPYANYSANLTAEARRLVDKYRTFNGVPIRERNQLQFERNIQDDFVKFMSLAHDCIMSSGAGVVAYITNGTMLASPSLRGMRQGLTRDFSSIYELNLHGGANEIIAGSDGAGKDGNVFDIVQSVAIHLYARSKPGGTSAIHYTDSYGTRAAKYASFTTQSWAAREWQLITPDAENCGFVSRDEAGAESSAETSDKTSDRTDATARRRLDSAFVQFGAGIKTNRDAVVIGFDDESLLESVRAFDRRLANGQDAEEKIHSLLYRPFDVRRIFFDEDAVASRSLPTMKHVLAGPNIGFVCSSTWTTPDRFTVGVSRLMVEMKTGTHDRGTTFFPLYRYEGRQDEKLHNLSPKFVKEWCDTTSTTFVPAGRGDGMKTTGPEDVFYWLYGLFHVTEYRRRYRGALSQGFPIVLLPPNLQFLRSLAVLGDQLAATHLLESKVLDEPRSKFVGGASTRAVTKVGWTPDNGGTVWIDGKGRSRNFERGTAGFSPVPAAVWEMHMAGYQVCEKWLKDRKSRLLSDDDIIHYNRMVGSLTETARLMHGIDDAIEAHGGWLAAFSNSR